MQRQTSETMSVVRKKLDDKYLKVLRELVSVTGGGNRQCFDCGQKGPTYVNMTIGSFVCTRCSGVLRGLTPPHRVKSISMATFTPVEIEFLKLHGNDSCAKTWLGLWDPKRAVYQDHRELMIDKYERKRYYLEPASPLKSLSNAPILKSSVSQMPSSVSALQSITTLNNNNNNNVNNANNLKVSTTYINTKSAKSFNNDINYFDNNLNGNSQTSPKHIKQNTVLTPPTGKRTNNNGLETCSSEINEPEQMEYYQSFSYHSGPPLPPSMTSTRSGNPFISANHDHTGNKGLKGSGIQNNKNGLNALESSLIRSNSETNKSFHFVADFKSANIFDATLSAVSLNESSTSLNNYTRSQSITSPRSTHESFSPINENLRNKEIITTNVKNGNSENFADFEHAPIFNAIEQQRSNNTNNNSIVLSNLTYNSKSQTVDRYAALKDLDEQLRESKAVAGAAVATSVVDSFLKGNTNSSNVNPFKFVPSSQEQVQHTANPFQANSNHTISTCCTKGISSIGISNVFASIQSQKNGCGDADGFRISGEENHQGYLDYGKVYASTTISHPPNLSTTMFSSNDSNSCGFGFTSIQPESTGSPSTAFNNPFVTTSSNNPFL